jgi:hypothetical protein
MSGPTGLTLNAGTGGSALGMDFDGSFNYEIVKLGFSVAGATPVQVSTSNPMPITLAGAGGTVNVVGTVPILFAAAGTFTLGTVALAGTPAVSLSGANGTVNIVAFPATQPVSLTGANGTVNLVGTAPVIFAANGTFTLGTVALAGNSPVTLTGANGTVNVVGTVPVQIVPQTGNGWSKWSMSKNGSSTLGLNTTALSVKTAAGELGGYIVYNPNTSAAFIQVFDLATSTSISIGTTRPDLNIPVPAGAGANIEITNGVAFANGIAMFAATTEAGLTGLATGLTVTLMYK